MLKIIDLLKGKTVIPEIDEHFVENQLLKYIEVEYEEELPEVFWLSLDAIESILPVRKDSMIDEAYPEDEDEMEDEDEILSDDIDDLIDEDTDFDSEETYTEISEESMSEELKNVFWILLDYLRGNSEFIDSDGNNVEELNEKGCYMVFERIEENPEYKVYGTFTKNGNPTAGYRLELYDDESFNEDFVGFGFPDENGNYEIEFAKENFTKDLLDHRGIPNLYMDIAELDKISGEFKSIKNLHVPMTSENEIVFDVNL